MHYYNNTVGIIIFSNNNSNNNSNIKVGIKTYQSILCHGMEIGKAKNVYTFFTNFLLS